MSDILSTIGDVLEVTCMYKIPNGINVWNNFKCFIHVKQNILNSAWQKYVIVMSDKCFDLWESLFDRIEIRWIWQKIFNVYTWSLLSPETMDNQAVKRRVGRIAWQMNHFCTVYVIRTDLWDNFYFDSVFANCSEGTKKCKVIVVAIFKTSLWIHQQDKMLPRIKICKWNGSQEQFSLSFRHKAKL